MSNPEQDASEVGMASMAPTEQMDMPRDAMPRESPYASLAPQDPHELGMRPEDQAEPEESLPRPPPRRGGFGSSSGNPPPPSGPPRPDVGDGIQDEGGQKLTGVSRRKQARQQEAEAEAAKATNKYDDMVERGGGAIESIMELEEEGREDLSQVVAAAPKVRNNKVQNLGDLDDDMHYRLPATEDHEIDLSLLTAFLCSSEQVDEPDEVWDPDILVNAVGSELHLEQEKLENKDGKEKEAEATPVAAVG